MLSGYFADDIPDFEYPNMSFFVESVTSRFANREAVRYRSGDTKEFTSLTYGILGSEIRALARFMHAAGLGRETRVAVWSENRPQWCVAYLAAVRGGFIAVPVDALLSSEEAGNVIRASGAEILWTSGKFYGKACAAARSCTSLRYLASFDGIPDACGSIKTVSYADALGTGSEGSAPALPESDRISPDDTAVIIFTSGTTGNPKGVELSHRALTANVNASIQSLPIYFDDVFMCVLPLHHTYPATCSFLSPLAVGASITIVEKLIGKVIVDDVRDSNGTIMIAMPLLYDKLMQSVVQGLSKKPIPVRVAAEALRFLSRIFLKAGLPGFGKAAFSGLRRTAGLSSLRLLVSGGGPLAAPTADFFDELGFCAVQGYGMTENAPLIATNTMKHKNNAAAGLPVKNTEIRIREPGPDGVGEIQVRSPSLMKGYWNDPEATASAFTADGWLHSGDLGYIDEDGYVFITGRSKNIIVTGGGKNIYPEEIESRFEGSKVIKEILITGKRISETDHAEKIVAVCVPDVETITAERGAVSTEELERMVREEVLGVNRRMPTYKKIEEVIVRREEFEKTSSRKIKRYKYSYDSIAREIPL